FVILLKDKVELYSHIIFFVPKAFNQIYKCHFPTRILVGKFRALYSPTGRLQLLDDIKSRFLQGFRAGGSRAESNQMLDVGKRFLAGKIFPEWRHSRTATLD